MFDIETLPPTQHEDGNLEALEAVLAKQDALVEALATQQLGKALARLGTAFEQRLDIKKIEAITQVIVLIAPGLEPEQRSRFESICKRLESFGKACQVANDQKSLEELERKLLGMKAQADSFEEEGKRAFEMVVRNTFLPMKTLGQALSALTSFEELESLGKALEKHAQEGLRSIGRFPPLPSTLDRVREERSSCQQILEQLREFENFDELRSLIELMRDGSATLADMTPELFGWLRDKGLSSMIRVML